MTEVAPIDAFVQRLGRVNRRGEKRPVLVIVYQAWSEGCEHIYGKEVVEWSMEILETLPEIPADAELAGAAHMLHERVNASDGWKRELEEGRQTRREVQNILGCYTMDLSDQEMRSRLIARGWRGSVEVLVGQFPTGGKASTGGRRGMTDPRIVGFGAYLLVDATGVLHSGWVS